MYKEEDEQDVNSENKKLLISDKNNVGL